MTEKYSSFNGTACPAKSESLRNTIAALAKTYGQKTLKELVEREPSPQVDPPRTIKSRSRRGL